MKHRRRGRRAAVEPTEAQAAAELLGRLGGLQAAANMTDEEREERARNAALKRWAGKKRKRQAIAEGEAHGER